MKHFMARFAMLLLLTGLLFSPAMAQNKSVGQAKTDTAKVDTTSNDDALAAQLDEAVADSSALLGDGVTSEGFHQALKTKFIEGDAGFMSLVALALVIGLAFCIERIIYLSLSEINAKKFMTDLDERIMKGDIEGAKKLCRDTRGPVASICYQGLERVHESIDNIERSVVSYGSVQAANLEKGCSWITLFIAMAPSLGFLLTTIFGIIVALILQVFYNYILSKIEHITSQMEESAITLLDVVMKYKLKKEC